MTTAAQLALHDRASQQDGTYPRPQLVRERAVLLDRQVGFAHDDQEVGLAEHWFEPASAQRFDRQIQLPFAPETELSGINDKGFHPCVWYRIELSSDDLAATGHGDGRRLLLHLGAVDYEAMVWADGHLVATHTGGQVGFTADLTDALDAEAETHVVVVRAHEDPLDTRQPRGKQDWLAEPHSIWYHRTTGIWRTVWLESVPAVHVTRLAWRADIVRHQVSATIELNQRPSEPVEVEVVIGFGGQEQLGQVRTKLSERSTQVTIDLPAATNGVDERLLWSPDNPALMDAGVVVGDDQVRSYLGYRSVGITGSGMVINGRPFYVRSVLQQGYWPQSHLTAPSVQALRDEAQLILDLGLNSARIHQKVEDPRFMFFADTMGLTLWGETAAAYAFDSLAVARLTTEWVDIVRGYESHPSIIAWVPFNESWGVSDIANSPAQQAFTRSLTDLSRALDPTRPVISNDGWEHTNSDLLTIHDYEWRREVLQDRYTQEGLEQMVATAGPAGRVLVVEGDWNAPSVVDAPVLVTEFGGVEFITRPSADETWGYSSASDPADFEQRVRAITEPIRGASLVHGFCWTQLTDTLQEANGLCDEHRTPKLPLETYRDIFLG